jgi:hypothetical protein
MHWLLNTRAGSVIAILLALSLALLLYFLPALIAALMGHPHPWGVFALDALAGWTVFGWIAALVWALWQGNGGTFDGDPPPFRQKPPHVPPRI